MSYDKAVDTAFLEGGLSKICNEIRAKTEVPGLLPFPDGIADAVRSIKGSCDKSMIIITAPEETTSASATYNGKKVIGQKKDGFWRLTGLDYGPGVVWTVEITDGKNIAKTEQLVEKLSIIYITLQYDYGKMYENGNEFLKFTGGWIAKASSATSFSAPVLPSLDKRPTTMVMGLKQDNNSASSGILTTVQNVDLTGFKLVTIDVDYAGTSSDSGLFQAYLVVANPSFKNWQTDAIAQSKINIGEKQKITVDVSNINGDSTVLIGLMSNWRDGIRSSDMTIRSVILS